MSCGLRRSMRLPSRSSMNTLTKCAQRIDLVAALRIEPAAAADHAVAGRDRHVEPDLVRVGRALREQVAQLERADHGFQQVLLARLRASAPRAAAARSAGRRSRRLRARRTDRRASRPSGTPDGRRSTSGRSRSQATPVLAAGKRWLWTLSSVGAVEELGAEIARTA